MTHPIGDNPAAPPPPGQDVVPSDKPIYEKPALTRLGSIVELTKAGGGSLRDFVQPRRRK